VIITTRTELPIQMAYLPGFPAAIEFLRSGSWNFAEGRVEIAGQDVFALLQSYTTQVPRDPVNFEGHRKYLDIQYIGEGREVMYWQDASQLSPTIAYDAEKDIWFSAASPAGSIPVLVSAGQLAVFFPSDAHAPMHAAGEPMAVKKIVIKIALPK
jgi:biofilm protein TabA